MRVLSKRGFSATSYMSLNCSKAAIGIDGERQSNGDQSGEGRRAAALWQGSFML